MKKDKTIKLDAEEQEILESVERGEWKRVENFQEEADFAKEAASYYLNKDARVNIRIPSAVLSSLKKKASYKGLPYQTFIASILHEYVEGHFQYKEDAHIL